MARPIYQSPEGMLPQNIEAEQAVLGSLLIDPRAVERVASFLRPEDFYLPVHTEIYRGMLALYERDRPADLVTLSDHLQAHDRLDDMGGAAYLASLANTVPTSINVEYYGRIVERLAVLRRLIDAGNRISAIGYDERLEADVALEDAERILFEISRQRVTRDFEPLASILAEVYEKIDHIHSHESEITGITTGFIDLDRITSGMQRSDLLILAARPSMGKCLSEDMLIDDPDTGERFTIREAVAHRISRVMGLSDKGEVRPTSVGDWIDSGVKPCCRVRTRTGREIVVTQHHPFLTVRGWTPLHDLLIGEKIAVPRAVPVFGSACLGNDMARLLAYFIAEGGLTDTCPKFTNTDPEIVADFRETVGNRFPECRVRQERITYIVARPDWRRGNKNHTRGGTNPVTCWLRDLDLMGKRADQKSFPPCVWQWDRPTLAEFLRALFSCDGSIYAVGGHPCIEFGVASEQLARDVHHALIRFGVISKLIVKGPRCWKVLITDPDSVADFQSQIGWIGEKARRFPRETRRGMRSNVGHLPKEIWPAVQDAAHSQGMAMIELARRSGEIPPERRGKFAGYNPHTGRGLPSKRLAAYARVLGDADLQRLASPALYWDEIVEIEPIGERQVYDLSVPDGSNFIAQDVCVHNTALALNIAHAVATRSKLPVGIFSVEMSAEQLAQRLIAVEAQIDSQKLRSGRMSDADWDRLVHAVGVLSEAPIFVDDTPGLTTMEMRSKARRLHSEQGLGLIVVDYLQLMQGSSSDSRVQEISAISRSLKSIARELDVPVLALSQLSRAPEQRPNHEPMLSDLRESGCLTADTRVARADTGAEVTLGELLASGERNVPVWSLNDEWKLVPAVMTHVFPSGLKPTFRLRLASGREVTASGNHPFRRVEGWAPLSDLRVGSRVAVPRVLASPQTGSAWPRQEVVMLAHLLGDGCVVKRQPVHYTSADTANLEAVEEAATHFGIKPRRVQQGNWWHVYLPAPFALGRGKRNPIAAWLDSFGLYGCHSWEKFLPSEVFSLPQEQIALFLRHLWATDGCLHVRTNQHEQEIVSIYYSTTSQRLAHDLQLILLRFGIQARLHKVGQGKYRPSFHVVVSGAENQLRFLKEIGVHGERGENVDRAVKTLVGQVGNPNVDTIPWEIRTFVVEAMGRVGMSQRSLASAIGEQYAGSYMLGSPSRPRSSSRERMATIARAVDDSALLALAQSDVSWDTVVAIEPMGEQPVFDATVLGTHNFLANNIVAHNSIEQDADVVVFIYRDVKYNPETERPHVADIIVAKHRNGPTGTVHLFFQDSLMRFLDLSIRDDAG